MGKPAWKSTGKDFRFRPRQEEDCRNVSAGRAPPASWQTRARSGTSTSSPNSRIRCASLSSPTFPVVTDNSLTQQGPPGRNARGRSHGLAGASFHRRADCPQGIV